MLLDTLQIPNKKRRNRESFNVLKSVKHNNALSLIALFTVSFSHLYNNVFQRGTRQFWAKTTE